jgi:hypothetical protein
MFTKNLKKFFAFALIIFLTTFNNFNYCMNNCLEKSLMSTGPKQEEPTVILEPIRKRDKAAILIEIERMQNKKDHL